MLLCLVCHVSTSLKGLWDERKHDGLVFVFVLFFCIRFFFSFFREVPGMFTVYPGIDWQCHRRGNKINCDVVVVSLASYFFSS